MTLTISAKCSDMFGATLCHDNGVFVGEYTGYVPAWFPNLTMNHFGDSVELKIDIETGKILNWRKPTTKDLKIFTEIDEEVA